MIYLVNAFSLNMLPANYDGGVSIRPLSASNAAAVALTATPAIGHVDTATVVAADLGLDPAPVVAAAAGRPTVTLRDGDDVLVAQYRGPRLAEGSTSLPAGATITYALVTVNGFGSFVALPDGPDA